MLVLKPSPVHGIGVFTTGLIASGAHLRLWQHDDWRFITFAEAQNDADVWAMRDIYCVTDGTGYHCPLDFHRMSIGWYMNHSDRPNVWSSKELNFEYYAVRDLQPGEEIFCDYRTLTAFESAPPAVSST
jgi:hypothetical protein